MSGGAERVMAMAMPFDVTVTGLAELDRAAAVRAFLAELVAADEAFSLYKPQSWMSRLSRGEVTRVDCPQPVREVLALCDQYRELTGGAFDARRPDGVLDPTGVVKTWAVAQATSHLGEAESWLVSASGDVASHGAAFTVGIADPHVHGDPAGTDVVDVVRLGGDVTALATSGGAQVASHIWDPVTGDVARHFMQVSVAGADLVACDVWATAICAGGPRAMEAAVAAGLEVLAIRGGRSGGGFDAVATPGWPTVS